MASPAKVIPLPAPAPVTVRKARATRAHLSPQELLAVLKVARARSIRDWTMILMCYRHAMRASEICGLRLQDIDLKAGTVTIARLKGSLHQIQPLYEHKGQPLLNEVAALRKWLRLRVEDGSQILFPSQKGGRLHRSSFYGTFCAIATAAGLPEGKRNPHILKHSLCSHLVQGNVNLVLIRQAAGHRSISSTLQYTHASDGQVAAAVGVALMGLF